MVAAVSLSSARNGHIVLGSFWGWVSPAPELVWFTLSPCLREESRGVKAFSEQQRWWWLSVVVLAVAFYGAGNEYVGVR